MRARKTKTRHWRVIVPGAAALAVASAGLACALFSPPSFLTVREVVLATPPKHISEMDLIRLSEVKKGDNLLRLRLAGVREKLLRYPWVREVRLSKTIPGRLQLWVEEEEPVALLDVNGLYLVNGEAKVFKKVEPGDPRDFPIITGLVPEDLESRLKPLVAVVKQFETMEEVKPIGISEVRWSRKGLSLFTKEPCVRVEMGSSEWTESLRRLGAVWPDLMTQPRPPKSIDLSLEKRIVVKMAASAKEGTAARQSFKNGRP